MTLFKQMALAISLIIVAMLASVIYINYQSAKNDMIEALYENSVNNISSLTNKLAQSQGDEALITSIIDSEFDSGYYKMIAYESADKKFTYKQEDHEPLSEIPAWFIAFTDIHIDPVSADVNADWRLLGRVTISPDPSSIYKGLYKNFLHLIYLFIITVIVTLVILSVMLHFILKPLKRIQHQAEAILRNEFVIEKKEPYTLEFREVAHAMNKMVHKVEDIFRRASEAAKRNKELLYSDTVTKLFNRRYLMLKLPELIELETEIRGGSFLLLSLNGAEHINEALGRKDGDAFFESFGMLLRINSQNYENRLTARVNGTEFGLVIPGCSKDEATHIAQKIILDFYTLKKERLLDNKNIYLNIGIYRYTPECTVTEVLTKADNALTKAKADEHLHFYLYEEQTNAIALPKEQWREIIEESLKNDTLNLKFWPTLDLRTKEINHKVMTFTIEDSHNKEFYYGDFIAPAIALGLVGKIYLLALRDLLQKQHKELENSICSIRLSNEFLKDPYTFDALSHLFETHIKKVNFKLYFEVADSFAMTNTATLRGYVSLFKKYGCGFGINAFTAESDEYEYLKELNPEFIKADVSFLLDQTEESMHSLVLITESLGIDIIASYVKTQEELEALMQRGISKIQGPITETL
jgi:diguanylate cyclase (GGDEF)-like protein